MSLDDTDIVKLVDALKAAGHSPCRFELVDPADLRHSIEFYKRMNTALDDSKNIIWRTIIVLLVSGIIALIGFGLFEKIKQIANGGQGPT